MCRKGKGNGREGGVILYKKKYEKLNWKIRAQGKKHVTLTKKSEIIFPGSVGKNSRG